MTAKTVKIENVRTGLVFALVRNGQRTAAAVTRKNGQYLLVTQPGTANRTAVEVRRDERIAVDYTADGVDVKVCTKDDTHGAFVVVGTGTTYCRPCDLATQKASRDRIKAAKAAGGVQDADAMLTKRDATRRIAEAKVDRLMSMLSARGLTLAQQDARTA